jgi:hypothetical protein
MEAICSSETLDDTHRTTRRHIPEDDTLHNHRCENLKSYSINFGLLVGIQLQTFLTIGSDGEWSDLRPSRWYPLGRKMVGPGLDAVVKTEPEIQSRFSDRLGYNQSLY